MKKIVLSAVTLMSLAMVLPAFAGPYGDAVSAHRYEEYDKAFPIFKQLASENNASAQFYLGHMYQEGEGVKKSKKKAKQWIIKAAEQGDDNARVALGEMYSSGKGVRKSQEKAFALFKLASDNGDPLGRYLLGRMYYWGSGVKEDEQIAFNLYSQVTRMDSWDPHLTIWDRWDPIKDVRRMRETGAVETFTPEQKAAMAAEQAEKQQYIADFQAEEAIRVNTETARLQAALDKAGPIENGLSALRSQDYKLAYAQLRPHADNGVALAQMWIGVMYRDGLGVERNDTTAANWLQTAGNNGSGIAYHHYARMAYEFRITLPSKLTNHQAEGWEAMQKSANLGYQPAKDFIQGFYERKQAEQDEADRRRLEQALSNAEEEARRAEHRRKYGRKTITNCDGPRPSDAPPVPEGYYCDRTPGSPTYGDYVRRN